MSDSKISFAGEVRVEEVSIINTREFIQTITPQVVGIDIFEDVFSPFITGSIVIRDSQDIMGLFPLVGNEFVRLKIITPSFSNKDALSGEFFIYKISDRFKISERELAYTLHFISKEALVDANKKISKTYSGQVSDIVKTIISSKDGLETIKPTNIDKTSSSTKYISNFWSPIQNIMFCLQNAVGLTQQPTFVFFENKHGLNFVSVESLYQSPVKQAFVWDQYSQDVSSHGGSSRNVEEDYKRILEVHTPETFDYLDRVQNGMYQSRMVHYDLVTKKYTSVNYTSSQTWEKEQHLNKFPLISTTSIARPNALIINEHKYYGNFNGMGDVTNTRTLQQRLSFMKRMEAFKIQITVPGRTDYTAGQKVNVKLFKAAQLQEKDNPESFIDQMHSGNYLIGAINHHITREKHECTMELIKDSFVMDVDKK